MSAATAVPSAEREAPKSFAVMPKGHALNYYAVLGTIEGLLRCLGYQNTEAHATRLLAECRPKRGRRRS